MDKIERIKIIKEALRQADANINFEEIPINNKEIKNDKIKTKGEKNGKRLLG